GFVGKIMRVGAIEIACVTVRPMTLFTGVLRRAKVLDGRFDRAVVIAGDDADELMNPVDLALNVCRSALANVTGDTIYAGVGRVEIGRKLRFHRSMTGLTAKLNRLGVMISVVTAHGGSEQEKHSCANKCPQSLPVTTTRKVDDQELSGRTRCTSALQPPLPP